MDRISSIIEQAVRMIAEDRAHQMRKFYQNQTLDKKIKDMIRIIQTLSHKKNSNQSSIFVTLLRFKDSLSIGNFQEIDSILTNQALPPAFCHSLQQINILFDDRQKQIDSLFDDVFFYKDLLQAAIGKRKITQQDINKRQKISIDKRKSAILMLQKIKVLEEQSKIFEQKKQMKEEDKEKVKGKDKEIKNLKSKILELQIKNNDKETKSKKAEQILEKMKFNLDKIEQQLIFVRRQKDNLEQSFVKKEKALMREIQQIKEKSNKEMKLKSQEIQKLKELIDKAQKQVDKSKNDLLNQTQIKLKEQVESKKRKQNKLKDIEKKLKQVQSSLSQKKSSLEKRQAELKKVEQQFRQYKKQNEKVQIDNQIIRKTKFLLQSAQHFNQFYNRYYPSKISQQLSLKQALKIQKIELKPFLSKLMSEKNIFKLLKQLKNPQLSQIIFRYPSEKYTGFAQKIKNKRNLLLLCSTQSGGILICFTEIGFTKLKPKERNNCFIFAVDKGQASILKLKKGKSGVREDSDFIVFGNYQFNLQNRCGYIAAEVNADSFNQVDFQGTIQERQKFLLKIGSKDQKIVLNSYTIFQLFFAK